MGSRKLLLKHFVLNKIFLFPTFRLILEKLRVEWRYPRYHNEKKMVDEPPKKIFTLNFIYFYLASVYFKEIDLSRKLSESYDMQEKLVADNADLEVKRFVINLRLRSKTFETEYVKV